ncbi:MAG: tRNA dihydrouridine synthase DusB [Gammaproteobacteria bacterium]|nr:tRNA dihydrouridine synthase DusB [Gammaproteobacteria bacterium]
MASSINIGPYTALRNRLVLSPMAGITDKPFRQICRQLGAGLTIAEMVASNPSLRNTRKSQLRTDFAGQPSPHIVQIAGSDPVMLADAARYNVGLGADIIDINMGCPAKKVCNQWAGSALLQDEILVGRILDAVVNAVAVPVTLKMRTGWDRLHKNAVRIARIAEAAGIQSLAVHGRTRADAYLGDAEYDTIAMVKSQVNIPVFANGDINSPQKAAEVLRYTQADGLYLGRASQGYPWLFREIDHYLQTGKQLAPPSLTEFRNVILEHLRLLYAYYGDSQGVRMARKHLAWYLKAPFPTLWQTIKSIEVTEQQYAIVATGLADAQEGSLSFPHWQHPFDASVITRVNVAA